MAPVILLTAASTVIDHVIFKNDDWSERSGLEERSLSANERHVLKRQAFASARQAQYTRLIPQRWQPPRIPPHLAYFYREKEITRK
mmetsp:Transcript_9894/g.12217  ORF Transcript_9894/g.12217 Transcript_9894/m.12217 type:complete len:86 (+) Transcript_9894:204-461(+)